MKQQQDGGWGGGTSSEKKYLKRNRVKNQYEKHIKRRMSCNELENSKAEDNKWTKILLQNFFRLNLY